jgi:hypothetical protein
MKVFNYVLKSSKNDVFDEIKVSSPHHNEVRNMQREILISCENYDKYERKDTKISNEDIFFKDNRKCVLCGLRGDYNIRSLSSILITLFRFEIIFRNIA